MDTDSYFRVESLQNEKQSDLHIRHIARNHNALILTANQRQTRYLSAVFDEVDVPLTRPAITTYPHWLTNLWHDLQDQADSLAAYSLSNPTQERFIWEQSINENPDIPPLIDTNSLCKYVRDAYQIMLSYEITEQSLLNTNDEETKFLSSSIAHYKQRLSALQFTSVEQLPKIIQAAYKKSILQTLDVIYLYGFAEIPPEMLSLVELASAHCLVLKIKTGNGNENSINQANQSCYHFDSLETELAAASRWAFDMSNEQPEAKIAIVAPNLTTIKPQLESALLKTFDPKYFLSNHRFETNKYFDISASDPLINIPVVDAIFILIKLREPLLDKQDCRKICTSIFWGQKSTEVTAKLLSWINNHSSPKIPPDLLNKKWAHFESQQFNGGNEVRSKVESPVLQDDLFLSAEKYNNADKESEDEKIIKETIGSSKKLSDFREALRLTKTSTKTAKSKYKSFNAWIDWLLTNLKNIGWPGLRIPNTYEYQQIQSFFNAMDALRSLDQCQFKGALISDQDNQEKPLRPSNAYINSSNTKVSLSAFLRELTSVCSDTTFHMQTKDTSVSVLGLMEASALPFDFCWVVCMSDDILPSAPNPNPFIPLQLQREHQTPRSTPKREFEYAEAFVRDLEYYCNDLIFSYTQNESSDHIKKSPLLENLIDSPTPANYLAPDIISKHYDCASEYSNFEVVPTGKAPKIEEGDVVPGGSAHISLYAVNPMFAFLRYRLFARQGLPESIGYTAIERGQLVHNILEVIYREHSSKSHLSAWVTKQNFTTELDKIIHRCLLDIQHSANKSISPALFATEKRYQTKQITSFLKLELQRDDFEVIETESVKTLDINGRKINLRIDRIDQVDDRYSIIFDYKTGSVSLSDLQTEPLFDCQLPLYTLINLAKPVGAVAYAEISKKDLKYSGIGHCPIEKGALKKGTHEKATREPDPIKQSSSDQAQYRVELSGVLDPGSLNKKSLPDSWNGTLQWWKEQLVYTVTHMSSGHCTYSNNNKSKSAYHSDLLYTIRPEEIIHVDTPKIE